MTQLSDKTYEITAGSDDQKPDERVIFRVGVLADELNNQLEWKNLPDAQIDTLVTIQLKDAGKFGTEVYVHFFYQAHAGAATDAVNHLLSGFGAEEWLKDCGVPKAA